VHKFKKILFLVIFFHAEKSEKTYTKRKNNEKTAKNPIGGKGLKNIFCNKKLKLIRIDKRKIVFTGDVANIFLQYNKKRFILLCLFIFRR